MVITALLLTSAAIIFYTYRTTVPRVNAYVGDYFFIPDNCKHIALLGCTPNPADYFKEHFNCTGILQTIALHDFLDMKYVKDSFDRTFLRCIEQGVEHLVIAYLPIYYVQMRPLLGDSFVQDLSIFLAHIIMEITPIIKQSADYVQYNGGITLIIPPQYQLSRVPDALVSGDERIRYLVKQFPKLKNISHSSLETITIINNQGSAEDEMLVNYFKYEYVYEKSMTFRQCDTGKERFHAEKRHLNNNGTPLL